MSLRSIASRVKDFFQRKPAVESGEDAVMPHKVSSLRPARLPNEIPYVIPKLVQNLRERRAKILTRESQKPLPLPKDPEGSQEIIPAKIHRWKLQEHHHVVRKIHEISKHQPSSRQYKIDMISDLSEDNNARSSQSELWEEALKSKEERHFQIGRITNFFS